MKREIVITYLVKEQLDKSGKTQADLSRLTGLYQPNINDIVQGKSKPTLQTLKKIALALECFTKDLYDEQELFVEPDTNQKES